MGADFEAINAALGRMIASVPESKVMAVYNAFSGVVSSDVPTYLMSTVKEADAKAAYAALMDFKDVVKAHPITPTAVTSSVSGAGIADAAKTLSTAAYPLLQDIDWSSDLALKKPGGASAKDVLKAIDKALVMGASMDGSARQSLQCRPLRLWMYTTPLARSWTRQCPISFTQVSIRSMRRRLTTG